MAHETFQVGDLTAVIGDNEAYDDRRPGYSGIHRLAHRTLPDRSLFGVAGLNFEHIFDGFHDQLSLSGDREVYGHFGTNHLFILMFDRTEGIRFAHSPSSGGPPSAPNPAWDFQFIIPKYEVLQEYGFRARAIFRERCSRDEIEQEFRSWRGTLTR